MRVKGKELRFLALNTQVAHEIILVVGVKTLEELNNFLDDNLGMRTVAKMWKGGRVGGRQMRGEGRNKGGQGVTCRSLQYRRP